MSFSHRYACMQHVRQYAHMSGGEGEHVGECTPTCAGVCAKTDTRTTENEEFPRNIQHISISEKNTFILHKPLSASSCIIFRVWRYQNHTKCHEGQHSGELIASNPSKLPLKSSIVRVYLREPTNCIRKTIRQSLTLYFGM